MSEIDYIQTDENQRADLRQRLLTQRLQHLEGEHVAAVFAVERIEQQIDATHRQLADLQPVE